jgi:hypothetical protein
VLGVGVLLGGHGFAPGLLPGVPGVVLPDPELLAVPDVPGEFTQGVVVPLGFVDPPVVPVEVEGEADPELPDPEPVVFGLVSGVPVVEGEVVLGVDPGVGVVVAPGVVLGVEVVPGVVLGVEVVPGVCVAPGEVLCGIVLCDEPAEEPAVPGVCEVPVLGVEVEDPVCEPVDPADGDELCPVDPVLEPVDCGAKFAAISTPSV